MECSTSKHLVFFIRKGDCRGDNDGVAGVDAHRIKIFHRADRDDVSIAVAHDLKFDLFPAGDTFFYQNLRDRGKTEPCGSDFPQLCFVCSDAAAGALLEARLETVPGAEKVFDFGALSYAHPKAGPQIEKRARARFKAEEPDAVRLALARAQAARRVVGSELAAGCAERGSEKVLVLSSKKGCWLRTVPSSDNAALWLLDMIRRAACDYPQAEGTGFLPARKAAQNGPAPEAGTNVAKPEKPRRKHHRGRWLLVLLLLAVLGAAVWYQYAIGGDWAKLAQLPQRIQTQGLDALKNFWQAYQPKPGTELI